MKALCLLDGEKKMGGCGKLTLKIFFTEEATVRQ